MARVGPQSHRKKKYILKKEGGHSVVHQICVFADNVLQKNRILPYDI